MPDVEATQSVQLMDGRLYIDGERVRDWRGIIDAMTVRAVALVVEQNPPDAQITETQLAGLTARTVAAMAAAFTERLTESQARGFMAAFAAYAA